ncbi:MAG TPA: TonB family protein [Pyrinomonadaceae bacterium]|jgi:protein TonB
MFNNLVESDLHMKEHVRRSWFFLGTLATYAVLFMILGVASIYAYDAHLEEQTNEYIVTFVPPVETAQPAERPRNETPRSNANATSDRHVSERTVLIDRVTNPNNVPTHSSAVASTVPPLPPGDVMLGNRNVDAVSSNVPIGTLPRGSVYGDGREGRTIVNIPDAPPPPTPSPTPPRNYVKSGSVLNGQAVDLPKPVYPQIAKNAHATGVVTVQVLIDETGKVISAQAVSGHPLLKAAAVQAAYRARFTPTYLSQQPVKVSGVITYNFTL